MKRPGIAVLVMALPLAAQDRWTEYRIGSLEVWSRGDERAAQETLNHLEQFRFTFGSMLGKPDAGPVFPIRVVLIRGAKQSGGLSLKREAWMAEMAEGAPPPVVLLRSLGRVLLDSSTARMPASIENGLLDLFSTLQVKGTRVTLGLPPAVKNRDWARMHLLAVDERFSGKLRVLLTNLERGAEPGPSYRNAFSLQPAEIEKEVDGHLQAATFGTVQLNAEPLDARRQLRGQEAEPDKAAAVLADLKQQAVSGIHPLIIEAKGDSKALEALAERFPKWGEPPFQLGRLDQNPARRLSLLAKAASLDPRKTAYWQALATEQLEQKQFAAAARSWASAERSAPTEQERQALVAARRKFNDDRIAAEDAERRRKAEEEARELELLKAEAENRIREAEARANRERGPLVPGTRIEQWWEGPRPEGKAAGMLERVDCMQGKARLLIRSDDSKTIQLLIRDPSRIVIQGGGEKTIGCGAQKPPRRILVEYFPKPDKTFASQGDAAFIEFP